MYPSIIIRVISKESYHIARKPKRKAFLPQRNVKSWFMKRTVLFTYRNVNDTSVKSYLVTRARNVASMQTCVKTTITRISNSRRRECTRRTYTIGLEDNVKNRFLAGRTRNPLFRILKRKGGDSLEGIVRWGEEREHNGRKKNNGVARWRTIDDTACVYIYIAIVSAIVWNPPQQWNSFSIGISLSLSLFFHVDPTEKKRLRGSLSVV